MMSTNSRKRNFELVTSSSSKGQSETTKTEWTKCIFCQSDKPEKVITPTESKK